MSDFFTSPPRVVPGPPASGLEPRKVAADRGWAWIVEAFQLVRKQLGMWVLLMLAYLVLYFLLEIVPLLGTLASNALAPVFGGGLMLAAHKTSRGEELELADLFSGFKANFGNLLVLGLAYVLLLGVLMVLIALLALLTGTPLHGLISAQGLTAGAHPSLLFLLLAGLVGGSVFLVASLCFWLAPALVVLNGAAPLPALKLSLCAGLKNWLPLTVCGVMLMILLLLAMLPLFLGLLLWMPVAQVAGYIAWREVFGTQLSGIVET